MGNRVKQVFTVVIGVGLVACIAIVLFEGSGFSAREEPSAIEAFLARSARRLAIPGSAYKTVSPLAATPAVLADARAHFADHCAICHANDGSGDTEIGRNLYPKAPDMRDADTQSLTDGELFYIITNGIRLTGMPAWGSGNAGDHLGSWGLVHFIRHLPDIMDDELAEMRKLNPVSPGQLAEEELERQFLAGESSAKRGRDHNH
jgi:mono/diheme cytochrome c family protein